MSELRSEIDCAGRYGLTPLMEAVRRRDLAEAQRLHVLPPGIASDRHLPEDAAQRRKALRTQLGLDVV